MRVNAIPVAVACLMLPFAGCDRPESAYTAQFVSLAIHNVTVIDPASRQVLPGMTVYIEGHKIAAMQPATDRSQFTATQEIDGNGKFLIPGLLDAHVHMGIRKRVADFSAPLFIANGVTGIRDMDADCWEPRNEESVCIDDLRQFRDRIESGEIVGPRLLSLSSPAVRGVMHRDRLPEGAPEYFYPSNEAEARRLAGYLKERGVDFIKSYKYMPRDAYLAMADEARRFRLAVAGHVPLAVSVDEAARAGQHSIEHARALPYDCSDYGPEYRDRMSRAANLEPGVGDPDDETRLRRTMEEYNPGRCQRMLKALVDNDTYYVPTHETREMDARAGDPEYRNDLRLKYMDKALVNEFWTGDLDNTAAASPTVKALFEQFYEHGLMITRLAHAAGVKVVAGTDANDTMVFPGFSMHDELVHLSKAGLEPMEILRAATTVPAQLLGKAEEIGAIGIGMNADLVLLGANPLDDIANSRSIDAVIFNGKLYDRPLLDALLASAERSAGEDMMASGESTREN